MIVTDAVDNKQQRHETDEAGSDDLSESGVKRGTEVLHAV
jgi:hypothetical protein